MQKVAIINPHLKHQLEHAEALEASGWRISHQARAKGDVILVSGPHFALQQQLGHPRLIMLDRAFWDDPAQVTAWHIDAKTGERRPPPARADRELWHPEPRPWKTREQSAVILCDYGMDPPAELISAAKARFHCVRIRKHPAEAPAGQVSLGATLAITDCAIGWKSSALVEAAIMGNPVVCGDPRNPAAPVSAGHLDATLYRGERRDWLEGLANTQVSIKEISRGLLSTLFAPIFRD